MIFMMLCPQNNQLLYGTFRDGPQSTQEKCDLKIYNSNKKVILGTSLKYTNCI